MQMNSPFFRNGTTQWVGGGVPSHPRYSYNYKPTSKVVSIPIHFVGSSSSSSSNSNSDSDSERTRSHSAIKIQKVTRGFLIRKTMNRIITIRNEVDQIQRMVSAPETVELMRRDAKERLRVSETIMNLLLKLDSVKALHSGVRNCRKSVIKRAIALQEMLDHMAVSVEAEASVDDSRGVKAEAPRLNDPQHQTQPLPKHEEEEEEQEEDEDGDVNSEAMPVSVEASLADSEAVKMEALEHTLNGPSLEDDHQRQTHPHIKQEEASDPRPDSFGASVADSEGMRMEALEHTLYSPSMENRVKMEIEAKEKEDGEAPDPESEVVSSYSQPISRFENVPVSVIVSAADSEGAKLEALEHTLNSPSMEMEANEDGNGEESVGTSLVEEIDENNEVGHQVEWEEEERGEEECNGGGGEVRDGNRELLERMVEDNERMMGLMAQLFERNEMQTRLLSSLSHRVEQLERAFACEKLRRKKKKRRNADAGHKESDQPWSCI